jgi:hypothetical protein
MSKTANRAAALQFLPGEGTERLEGAARGPD